MSEYVPKIEELIDGYVHMALSELGVQDPRARLLAAVQFQEEASRALAAHDAQVLREAAEEIEALDFGQSWRHPYDRAAAHKWGSNVAARRLRARADRIAQEGAGQ